MVTDIFGGTCGGESPISLYVCHNDAAKLMQIFAKKYKVDN